MPIHADLRHFYGREWRLVTRPRILARAGNRCEQCDAPNGEVVHRVHGFWFQTGASWALGAFRRWRTPDGGDWDPPRVTRLGARPEGPLRKVRIILTIAHLNHVAGDDRGENLRAWCQWCHLHHDLGHHASTRAARKDAARPLIAAAMAAFGSPRRAEILPNLVEANL